MGQFAWAEGLSFTEVASQAGAKVQHDHTLIVPTPFDLPDDLKMSGGAAAGDFDRDGDVDLYVITGDAFPNALLVNQGDGTFVNRSAEAGVGLQGHDSSGPVFADIDSDGWPDLVVGGTYGAGAVVFKNLGDGKFSDVSGQAGFKLDSPYQNDFSASFGDPDQDGDLDAYIAHWSADSPANHLWLNSGSGRFVAADTLSGIAPAYEGEDWSFLGTFTDFTGDGLQDLLVVSDYDTSHHFVNTGALQFENTTTPVIDDQSGMGSAVADIDNDGDLDWFVTSIWWGDEESEQEKNGNRLYLNDGQGQFSNGTENSGVAQGGWGWAACAADFDNDGWLDLFHVNGMFLSPEAEVFVEDLSPLFMNQGDGTFAERAEAVGIVDQEQGRGLVCFDYDNDGDIDIFIQNLMAPSRLFRNDLVENPGYLQVRLEGELSNPQAIGAKIRLTAGGVTQLREVTIGSNYLSQNPLEQHFGLGGAAQIDELRVTWPHGGETVITQLQPNQKLTLSAGTAAEPPFALNAGVSGAWFDPAHSGEGFVFEILNDGVVVMYWFTYDGAGAQDWYVGVGHVRGRRVVFPELIRTSGGEFGPGFDPTAIERTVVGEAAFTWTDCSSGFMEWSLPGREGQNYGRQVLIRLTSALGLDCESGQASSGPDGLGLLSGSWFDPTHDGEGYVLEILAEDIALVYWFSYDAEGRRRWFYGVGEATPEGWLFEEMLTTNGPVFGDGFDPESLETPYWGKLLLELECGNGVARFESDQAGFPAGELQLIQLTRLGGVGCE